MVRAFQPRPGAWLMAGGQRYKIGRAIETIDAASQGELQLSAGRVVLGLADEAIEVITIQPPGGRPLAAVDWMNGRRGEPLRLDASA
jgi:methionyl-tRNA formyltransferase